MMAEGRTIKNKQEILDLLTALWLPAKLAIIHYQGHQKTDNVVARGNRKADQAAKAVALTSVPTMTIQLPDPGHPVLPDQPKYSQEDLQWIKKLPMAQKIKGWWYTPNKKLVLPDRLGVSVLEHMHRSTHMGARKLKDLIRHAGIKIHQQDTKIEQVVSACKTCQLTNARATSNKKGTRLRGTRPGAQCEVDFTEVKPGKYGYKYLFVFTDTFSGWVEAYPTKHETAQTVAKKLLEDILPRYGFPAMVGSDNGPAFISQKVHEDIWPHLCAIYEAGPTPTHHQYRPEDWVYVKRHRRETLEPAGRDPTTWR
ncbi:uncharacterized protein LOC113593324 isoform X2 [Acinonyx jubatus]|uniref:Uncharacterized protein LOC113593324 isoform X2 n=1 Tax=Acinonyx jubatus TaxID=32536 RepID=A0ABM3P5I5_ACIJB|nr:uncharacterized protein LOC113593324 isoform X2 [Acinonyx jubatus]